jgi:hypothetical protein
VRLTHRVEGWHGDQYYVFFSEAETAAMSESYAIDTTLPGYTVVGLLAWDDFIVQDRAGNTFSLPAVPCDPNALTPFTGPDPESLVADERFTSKVKWYIKPVIFGGDPSADENMTWIPLEQHAAVVCWWNRMYRDVTAKQPSR